MSFERNMPPSFYSNETIAEPNNRSEKARNVKRKIMAGLAVAGVVLAGSAHHIHTENERIHGEIGTSQGVSGGECIEILPGAKLREEADGRDLTWADKEENIYIVEDTTTLCNTGDVRLKQNVGGDKNFLGLDRDNFDNQGIPKENLDTLEKAGDNDLIWVYNSDETAHIVEDQR